MELKEKIREIILKLDNIICENNYKNIVEFDTAVYCIMRYGTKGFEEISENKIEQIHNTIYDWDYSIMNENLIDYIKENIYNEEE